MYGLIQCALCKRPRIVDLSKSTSSCPYCDYSDEVKDSAVLFRSKSQQEVRQALSQAMGVDDRDAAEKRSRVASVDPYSTMVYRYEHCRDQRTKLTILAEGLTEARGEFTLEDVEEVVGDRAEKVLKAMLDHCIAYESHPGRYRVRSHFLVGMSSLLIPCIFRTSRTTPGSLTYML